jgi:hypothetical protein
LQFRISCLVFLISLHDSRSTLWFPPALAPSLAWPGQVTKSEPAYRAAGPRPSLILSS